VSQELLYTSAPHGLKPGSRGFCTVLSTQGMAAPLASALEGLSGYRPAFPAGDEQAALNPVNWSHLTLQVAGRNCHVLSRIAEYGLDYSQRTNKLAHHVVLDPSELITAGPAALLAHRNFMRADWTEEPRLAPPKPVPKIPPLPRGVCQAWKDLTGDGGWAGVLAESFLRDPERPVILLYAPGQDMLPLIAEALSLIPADRRWDVTFSTYFTGLPQGVNCTWRCLLSGSPEAHQSLRFVRALRLDLSNPESLGTPAGNELVNDARGVPRLKSTSTDRLPPLPSTPNEGDSQQQLLATDTEDERDGTPPLPGRDVYPTRQALKPPSPRQNLHQTATPRGSDDSARRRKYIVVIAGAVVAILLISGVGIGLAIRNRPALLTANGDATDTHQQSQPGPDANRPPEKPHLREPQVDGTATPDQPSKPPKSALGQEPAQTVADAPSKPTKNSPSTTVKSVDSPDKPGAQPKSDDPHRGPAPTLQITDKVLPWNFPEQKSIELLSLAAASNPFASIELYAPANLKLEATSSKSKSNYPRLEISERGAFADAKLAAVSVAVKEATTSDKSPTFALNLTSLGDKAKVAGLQWGEILVGIEGQTGPGTRLHFHKFPLDVHSLKSRFAFTEKGVLEAQWNLKIVSHPQLIPELQLTELVLKHGDLDFRFTAVPTTDSNASEVRIFTELKTDAFDKEIQNLIPNARHEVIADALSIAFTTLRPKVDNPPPGPIITHLQLGGFSKLEKLLSDDCRKTIDRITDPKIGPKIRRWLTTKKIKFDTKHAATPLEVETVADYVLTELRGLLAEPPDKSPKPERPLDLEALNTGIAEFDRLKQASQGLASFKESLKQLEIKSAVLFYDVVSPDGQRRQIDIFAPGNFAPGNK
jgi:hypothetical protein